ncbi:chitin synthase-domain-containing protein [Suillus occidentalis]|nr:chitin synthase-domain-containing protein [Suillus occidentalis]
MTKAFEAMFGGVTCLPGCFSIYRIKTPKGNTGYLVPILANPDINLFLFKEDRYLTTLLLKMFPRRKQIFRLQAVCKTIVTDMFRVLLSQRRRWINPTIHKLFELVVVRNFCGTFCFSMQFVMGMDLMGTLGLLAAIRTPPLYHQLRQLLCRALAMTLFIQTAAPHPISDLFLPPRPVYRLVH